MTKYKLSIEQLFYVIVALFVTLSFCHLALVCYFADSEIWLLTLSQQTFQNTGLSSIQYKWSFHALTYAFSHFAPSEWTVYLYARCGWMTVALAAQVMTAYAFSRFAENRKLFFPLFIVLMTFTAFFNQGFRIRSDILSLFAHAAILVLFFKSLHQRITVFHYAAAFAFNLLLASSTPKAAYLFIAQFAFAMSLAVHLRLDRRFFLFVWLSHVLPIVLICAALMISHISGDPFNLMTAAHEAADYYLKSFDTTLSNASYFSVWDFAHIIKTFSKSLAHTLVFVCGFAIYLWQSFRQKKPPLYSSLNVYFGVLLVFVVLHNQKLPFFIGTFGIPLIAYTYVLTYKMIEHFFKSFARYINMLLIGTMMLLCILDLSLNLSENNNLGQQVAIETLDNYMIKNPKASYYDTIGILPRKNTIFLFVGPGEVSRKKQIIADLDAANPTLIIYTFKFNYLEPDIRYYLESHRVEVTPRVWVPGRLFSIVKNSNMFEDLILLNKKPYWRISEKPKKYVFDKRSGRNIASEIRHFKGHLETNHFAEADSFAVPRAYVEFFHTDVEPIYFLQTPYDLFRYDTLY